MRPITPARGATLLRVFGMPMLLALVSAIGLTSALLGDGIWDVLSWAALGASVAVIVWHVVRPARGCDWPGRAPAVPASEPPAQAGARRGGAPRHWAGHCAYGEPLTRYDLRGGMFDGLSATLGVTSVGTRKGDDANSFELPDCMGTDLGMHYRPLKHAEVGFFVENLVDEEYVLSAFDIARTLPDAPRTFIDRLQRRVS